MVLFTGLFIGDDFGFDSIDWGNLTVTEPKTSSPAASISTARFKTDAQKDAELGVSRTTASRTDSAADAAERQRVQQAAAYAEESGMSAFERLQKELAETKTRSAKAQEDIDAAKGDYATSQSALAIAAIDEAEAATAQAETALASATTAEEKAAAEAAIAAAKAATEAAQTQAEAAAALEAEAARKAAETAAATEAEAAAAAERTAAEAAAAAAAGDEAAKAAAAAAAAAAAKAKTEADKKAAEEAAKKAADAAAKKAAEEAAKAAAEAAQQKNTNIDVLKSMLRGMGFNSSIIDSSTSFLLDLLKDGLDYDNAVSIFLNSKDYTLKSGKKIDSPFYAEYGYLNEGLVRPKTAAELYNAVEGYKEISDKYRLNSKFTSKDYLKKYVKSNVTVAQLDERANTARLKAINADPAYLESLRQLKYINESTDLTDFFLDPNVGQETLEQRRGTAAFSAEAIRRAGQGVMFDATRFEKTAAGLVNLGLSEAQIGASAAQGFENIAQTLKPMAKLEEIYNKYKPASSGAIQQELEAEEFLGTASERRARLRAREIAEYSGEAGTSRGISLIRRREGII